jgi:hypothetical protein
MPKSIATIVTQSHLSWALSLYDSVMRYDTDITFFVLISDVSDGLSVQVNPEKANIKYLFLQDLLKVQNCIELVAKYTATPDNLRWSLKPVLMNYIHSIGYEKMMFCDCDILFFSDFAFIWQLLDTSSVVLSPHFFDHQVPQNVHTLHATGIVNGGFFAINRNGNDAMNWWARMCLDKCNSKFGTINVDQGYLEILPFFFNDVHILKHKGCNVGYWSLGYLKREIIDGKFFVNDGKTGFPLVFYHFASARYEQFYSSETEFLGVLEELNVSLKKNGYSKDVSAIGRLQLAGHSNLNMKDRLLSRIKRAIPYRVHKLS